MKSNRSDLLPKDQPEAPAGFAGLRAPEFDPEFDPRFDYELHLNLARACLAMPDKTTGMMPAGWRRTLSRTATAFALSGLTVTSLAFSANTSDSKASDSGAQASGVQADYAPRSEVDIRLGRADQSSVQTGRIEIYGSVGSRASVRRAADKVIIRLATRHRPEASDLKTHPPQGVSAVDMSFDGRAYEITLTLKDKAEAHFGRADGSVFIQISPAPDSSKPDPNTLKVGLATPEPAKPAQKPVAGPQATPAAKVDVVPITAQTDDDGALELSFAFNGPAGSAIFRRGEAVWVVFDKEYDLRLPANLKDGQVVEDAAWVHNDGFTALRLKAPMVGAVTAVSDNLIWRIRLGGKAKPDAKATEIGIGRDDSSGETLLSANLAGASKIAWIRDPVVGDRMAVVTARGPVKAVSKDRIMVQASFAATAHGVVIERMTPDISVKIDGDLVQVSRPGGLSLSNARLVADSRASRTVEYGPAPMPGLMDDAGWSKLPTGMTFLNAYNQLQSNAADEAALGPDAPTKARLSLARFLVGQKMNYEAQGVLDLLIRQSPRAASDPQARGLRVIAKNLTGRYKSAEADLDSSALMNEASSNLWRGYVAAKSGHWADARKAFGAGANMIERFPPMWRARFAAANAQAALNLGDIKAAQPLVFYAIGQDIEPLEKLDALLVTAAVIEASGDKMRALGVYQEIAKASSGRIATPAMMHAAKLRLDLGKSTSQAALDELDRLRFRWRGDETELEIIGTLGDIYLSAGRYREALNVLKSGGKRFFDKPEAVALTTKLNAAFRGLFLQGMADALQPIEALGLFYDFKDLTPVGSDGDEMVRKLARRLIDVDLLDQAAELLQYQIDNRLDGVAKAAVASDLAAIHLMNRQPERALQALWKTRTSLLPKPLMSERRVLEARALSELNRPDDALDALGTDTSPDATDVRADIYWRQKDWLKAANLLEKRLGDRFKSDSPLSLADESRLIRAGVGYSLLSDQKSLERLSLHFGKFINTAQSADAMRVALAGMDDGPASGKDFALAAAQADSFAGWVSGMKQKLRDRTKVPLPTSGQAAAARPAA